MLSAQNAIQIKTLTTEEGLNFRHVNSIAQDEKGFMWFGTYQGITKYDGNTFKIFDTKNDNSNFIPYEQISSLVFQKSINTIWFVANYRLFALDLDNEKLREIEGIDMLIPGQVLEIALDRTDNLWLVIDNSSDYTSKIQHLVKYDGKDFYLIKSLERKSTGFTKIAITASNNICWTTVNHGLMIINQEGKIIKEKIIDTYDWYDYSIHFGNSFFDSKNTHYYFSEKRGGVSVYENLEFKDQLVVNERTIKHAVEDSAGGIWFVGFTELFYLDVSGEVFDYSEQIIQSLDFSNINYAFLDSSDLLWLGTDNGLIKVKLQPQNFEKILEIEDKGWGRTFRDIFPLKNGLIGAMCESENQIYKIDDKGLATPIKLPDSENHLKDARFFISDTALNKAYTVTNYLVEIDFETNTIVKHDKFSAYINETKPNPLLQLKDGSFIVGHEISKLIKIDTETMSFQPVLKDLSEHNYTIKALLQSEFDPEIIWAGTVAHGLFKINLNGKIEAIYDLNSTPSLSKNQILTLCEANDRLLVGTFGGGISVLDLDNNTIRIIDTQDGLSDNNVVSIMVENKHEIIAGTYNGLSRINLETIDIQNYFEEDGISNNEFNYPSSHKSGDGQYYLGGMNGITKFSFNRLFQKKVLPALNFTQLEFYNQQIDSVIRQTALYDAPISLSPYDINLKVDWSVPDYFNKENYTYYTMLEGFDNSWFNQGNASSIRYNQLPAGEYTLKIKGIDTNGNTSKAGIEIPIIVNQIFYKTWWFILLVIAGIAGIVYSFFQYRLQQALALERLRTKISSDLHDDVGSMLTGLAMQTEMLEMQAKTNAEKKKLRRLTELSRNSISHIRDFAWSIDSRKDNLEDLVERMKEYAEEVLLPRGISFKIDVETKNLCKKLNLNCRRNLFLIFKEAITNITKHSDAKHVNITLQNNKGVFEFSIRDNGTVKQLKHSSGLGLANMKLRAENIDGALRFEFQDGFRVSISIPHIA